MTCACNVLLFFLMRQRADVGIRLGGQYPRWRRRHIIRGPAPVLRLSATWRLAGLDPDYFWRTVMTKLNFIVAASMASLVLALNGAQAQPSNMTFFVTSTGSGKGADFGGLAGADKHCQSLATAAGAGNHTWRAYLSSQGPQAVN